MTKKILASFALLAALSACGDGGGRPSTSEVAEALRDGDNQLSSMTTGADDAAVDCMAKALHASGLSDDALQAMVDGDEGYEGSGKDEEAISALTDEITECVTAA